MSIISEKFVQHSIFIECTHDRLYQKGFPILLSNLLYFNFWHAYYGWIYKIFRTILSYRYSKIFSMYSFLDVWNSEHRNYIRRGMNVVNISTKFQYKNYFDRSLMDIFRIKITEFQVTFDCVFFFHVEMLPTTWVEKFNWIISTWVEKLVTRRSVDFHIFKCHQIQWKWYSRIIILDRKLNYKQ